MRVYQPKKRGARALATVAANRRVLEPVLKELNLDLCFLDGLSRRSNVQEVVARLRALVAAGVPTTGLVFKVSLSESKFQQLLFRYSKNKGVSQARQDLLDFMVSVGISRKVALRIARRRVALLMRIPQKIAFFNSFRLDPKRYGVERIPPKYYLHLFGTALSNLRRGIKKQVLWKLEDDFSASKLDSVFPKWRSVKSFFPKKGTLRPTKILKMVRVLIAAGIALRTDYIPGTVSRALRKNTGVRRAFNSKIFDGTVYSAQHMRAAKNERVQQIRALEAQIVGINKKINNLDLPSGRSSSHLYWVDEALKQLRDIRSSLVKQRDALLAE